MSAYKYKHDSLIRLELILMSLYRKNFPENVIVALKFRKKTILQGKIKTFLIVIRLRLETM